MGPASTTVSHPVCRLGPMPHTIIVRSSADGRACADCQDAVDHCHGTLILHVDGEAECTEDGCQVDFAAHSWMGSCWDVLAGCGCGTPAAPAVDRAA